MNENYALVNNFFQAIGQHFSHGRPLSSESVQSLKDVARHMDVVSFEITNAIRMDKCGVCHPKVLKRMLESLYVDLSKAIEELGKEEN